MLPPGPVKATIANGVSDTFWKIISKADALARLNPDFSSLTLEAGLLRKRKRPIGDPQIDLDLAQQRTYKVRKKKGRQISGPRGRIRDTQI